MPTFWTVRTFALHLHVEPRLRLLCLLRDRGHAEQQYSGDNREESVVKVARRPEPPPI